MIPNRRICPEHRRHLRAEGCALVDGRSADRGKGIVRVKS